MKDVRPMVGDPFGYNSEADGYAVEGDGIYSDLNPISI